jgi:hypothetical protein
MFQGLPIKARPMRPSDNALKQDWCRHKMLAALVAVCCSPDVRAAGIRRMNAALRRAISSEGEAAARRGGAQGLPADRACLRRVAHNRGCGNALRSDACGAITIGKSYWTVMPPIMPFQS